VLAQAAHRIAMGDRHFRDFTLLGLTRALTEIVCAFPVYRTYLRAETSPNEAAGRVVRSAVRLARLRNSAQSPSIFAFFEQLLLLQLDGTEDQKARHTAFALRFQQLTGPIMAKAVEDTAFYRYPRLLSQNEVGGSPAKLATQPRDFHRDNAERARSWPLSMITTATHDTKRGDDAAARIAVLSEVPEQWQRSVGRWREMAGSARSLLDDSPAPDATLEYLFYQALVGAWPFGADPGKLGDLKPRLSDYLLKAAREAKTETSWLTSNLDYEAAVRDFVDKILEHQVFLQDFAGFCADIDSAGAVNALAQALLRLSAPGVPDTYQGGELWNQSLVDPDNRRPVDYELRRRYLAELGAKRAQPQALVSELLETYPDGRIKLFVTQSALALRRQQPELFAQGDYTALDGGEHVVAFTRSFEAERLVCVVPRLSRKLTGGRHKFPIGDVWGERALSGLTPGRYRNCFTGAQLELADSAPISRILAEFPVALLIQEPK
jgi:(1->4)-alpha-D-glucan 1-alpha-D-glucosylmutase